MAAPTLSPGKDAHAASSGQLEDLLRGSFAIASPRGDITRLGLAAAALLGVSPDELSGQSLFDAVLEVQDGGWRDVLEGASTSAQPLVKTLLQRPDGSDFACELRFFAVAIEDGLDFSHFASDLSDLESPGAQRMRLKAAHGGVVRMIEEAARSDETVTVEGQLAGIVITFRSIGQAPDTAEELTQPAESIRDKVRNMDSAEITVQEQSAMEPTAPPSPAAPSSEPAVARLEPQAAAAAPAPEPAPVHGTPPGLAEALSTVAELRETVARLEASQAIAAQLAERVTQLEASRSELAERAAELEATRAQGAELAERVARLETSQPAAELVERMSHLETSLTAAAELADRIARVEEQASTPADLEQLRSSLGQAVTSSGEARQQAAEAQREARMARRALAVFRRLAVEGDLSEPHRPAREGFDDATVAMATLTLDGDFMELNPAFRDLVGYSEEEFAGSRWPSSMDRPRMEEHEGLRAALAAGELEGEHIQASYMHREGLLVELRGRISLVRSPHGTPDHLLFTLDPR